MIRLVNYNQRMYLCSYLINLDEARHGINIYYYFADGKKYIGYIPDVVIPDAWDMAECEEFDTIVKEFISTLVS